MKKDTIVFYKDWKPLINSLSDENKLIFWDLFLNYEEGLECEVDAVKPIWNFVSSQIKKSDDKYLNKVKKLRANGKKGGNPNFKKGQSNPYYSDEEDKQKVMSDNQTLPKITKDKLKERIGKDRLGDVDDRIGKDRLGKDRLGDDNINVDAIISNPIEYLETKYPTEYRERITPKLENLIPKSEQSALMIKYCARVVLKIQNGELQPQKESLFAYLIGFITSWRQHNDNYKRKLESAGRI